MRQVNLNWSLFFVASSTTAAQKSTQSQSPAFPTALRPPLLWSERAAKSRPQIQEANQRAAGSALARIAQLQCAQADGQVDAQNRRAGQYGKMLESSRCRQQKHQAGHRKYRNVVSATRTTGSTKSVWYGFAGWAGLRAEVVSTDRGAKPRVRSFALWAGWSAAA